MKWLLTSTCLDMPSEEANNGESTIRTSAVNSQHSAKRVAHATIIEKMSWDTRSILVIVFLSASTYFRLNFSNDNVHI